MNFRNVLLASAVMFGASVGLMADYIPYPKPGKIAPAQSFTAGDSGDVVAYFYGSHAGYENQLGLFVNGKQLGSYGLDDHTSHFGDMIDFGYVTAGTTLVFALDVKSTKTILYSDPSMNPDKDNHTYGTPFSGMTSGGVTIPAGTFVGFEDMLAAAKSDFNYTDEEFVLTDTTVSTLTPEPAPVSLIAGGLFIVAGLVRRRRA